MRNSTRLVFRWFNCAPLMTMVAGTLVLNACARAALPETARGAASPSNSAGWQVQPPGGMRMYGQPANAADGDSIRTLMARFAAAWTRGDAASVASAFAADAEWTNAFGRVKRDRVELEDFLRNALFVSGGAAGTQGRSVLNRPLSFRFLGSDAAIMHLYAESEGQLSPKGTPMGYRRMHTTFVLARQPEGWRIVHQMIMDQRDTIP